MNNQNSAGLGYVVYNNVQLSDNERKLYEDKIKLMEELIPEKGKRTPKIQQMIFLQLLFKSKAPHLAFLLLKGGETYKAFTLF